MSLEEQVNGLMYLFGMVHALSFQNSMTCKIIINKYIECIFVYLFSNIQHCSTYQKHMYKSKISRKCHNHEVGFSWAPREERSGTRHIGKKVREKSRECLTDA